MNRFVLVGLIVTQGLNCACSANWSSSNIQILAGEDFLNPYTQNHYSNTIVTLEHASNWNYGDNFFFIDIINGDGGTDTQFYGELQPRFSLSKIGGYTYTGVVKDVLIATQWNFGKDDGANVCAYLLGVGVDLAISGSTFFQVNAYHRSERNTAGQFHTNDQTWQLTVAGHFPIYLGKYKLSLGGFADFIGPIESNKSHVLFVPQILFDLGDLWNAPGTFEAGVEYSYWRNKFGVEDQNERVTQLMIKWTL